MLNVVHQQFGGLRTRESRDRQHLTRAQTVVVSSTAAVLLERVTARANKVFVPASTAAPHTSIGAGFVALSSRWTALGR